MSRVLGFSMIPTSDRATEPSRDVWHHIYLYHLLVVCTWWYIEWCKKWMPPHRTECTLWWGRGIFILLILRIETQQVQFGFYTHRAKIQLQSGAIIDKWSPAGMIQVRSNDNSLAFWGTQCHQAHTGDASWYKNSCIVFRMSRDDLSMG